MPILSSSKNEHKCEKKYVYTLRTLSWLEKKLQNEAPRQTMSKTFGNTTKKNWKASKRKAKVWATWVDCFLCTMSQKIVKVQFTYACRMYFFCIICIWLDNLHMWLESFWNGARWYRCSYPRKMQRNKRLILLRMIIFSCKANLFMN